MLVAATIPFVLMLFAVAMAIRVRIIRTRRVRETFAFWIVLATVALAVHVAIAGRAMMPWQLPLVWYRVFAHAPPAHDVPRAAEYILLAIAGMLLYRYAAQLHQQWDGQRSLQHQRQNERGERSSMLRDAVGELRRIFRGGEVQLYNASPSSKTIAPLETVRATWRDEAREILRLRTPAYVIEADDWLDTQGCWLGRNSDTGDPVFLFPTHEPPADDTLRRWIASAQKLEPDRGRTDMELIVAIEEPSTTWTPFDEQVVVLTRDQLLDNLVDFSDYRRAIFRRVETTTLPDSDLRLPDVYVPGRLADGTRELDAETHLHEWLDDASQRQLAMLGDYGHGKSTTALMFTYALLKADDWRKRRIPILIELRGTSPRNLQPLSLLGAWSAQYNINAQALLKLHIAGKILLIFEGFDEMALVGDAEMRLKHFKVLWQFCYERAKIMITGRPNFFLDDTEMRQALGIHAPVLGRPYCEAVRLVPFTPDQIERALRAHTASVRDGITSLVQSNERFADLVSRPSLLHIVSVLWERDRLYEKVDQLDSAFVMDLFVRHSYRRQGLKESESPEFMALTSIEREYFMKGVATYMAAKKLPNQITTSQLNQLIIDLSEAAPASLSDQVNAMTGEATVPLRERLANSEYGIEHVKTDVRTCGLLIDDPAAPGTFRFGHKSFFEYLVAATFAERILEESDVSRILMKETEARLDNIMELPVAMTFLTEIVERSVSRTTSASGDELLARRLLRAVSGRRGLGWLVDRLALYDFAVSGQILASFLAPSNLGVTIAAALILAITITGTQLSPSFMGLLGAVAASGIAFRYFTMERGEPWHVWVLLCSRLGISDHVLQRIAGTWWIPGTGKRSFGLPQEQPTTAPSPTPPRTT